MEATEKSTTGSKHNAANSNEGSVMTKENTLFLISLVKSYGCLWNQGDPGYTNESAKQNAWINISKMMGYPVKEVKEKWDNVSSCFYMFHSKSLGNVIKHKWFAYDALRFLDVKPLNKPPYDTQPKLRWNDERKLYFISLVKRNECLWNTSCPDYKDALGKKNAWKAISKAMECSADDLKWKWTTLRASFRMYHSNVETSSENERSSNYAAATKWYAYEALSFLANQPDEDETLDPALMAECDDEGIASLSKTDSVKEEVTDSEIVTLVDIRDNKVVCKSIDELAAKPPEISPSTRPKPQTQVGNALRIDRRSQPWTKTPVRVKRTYPIPVEDPLQIKQTPQTQLVQVGAPFQNVQRRSLGGRPTLNPSSVKSFVNLIEQELSEISSDYATMAQVDIYKIIGEYKLKDVRRSSEASSKPMKTKVVKQVTAKRIEPKPVKIAPTYSLGNNDMLEVALECEEDAS